MSSIIHDDDSEERDYTSDDDSRSFYSEYSRSASSRSQITSTSSENDNDDNDDHSIASNRLYRMKQAMVVAASSMLILFALASVIVVYDQNFGTGNSSQGLKITNDNRTQVPSNAPSTRPRSTGAPSLSPTITFSKEPSLSPTSQEPSLSPSVNPTVTAEPSSAPTSFSQEPSLSPTTTQNPTIITISPHPSFSPTTSPTTCVNEIDWKDSTGDTCEVYRSHYRDIDGYYYCNTFGNYLENDGKTANTACCICGGGTHTSAHPSISPAPSSITISPQPTVSECEDEDEYVWWDWWGAGCSEYNTQPKYCVMDLDKKGLFGKTAQEACCICGGGRHIPYPDPPNQ